MILYHGSYQVVDRPDVSFGRNKVDFGRGFYLTGLCEQACAWALNVSRRYKGAVPSVSKFEFSIEEAKQLAGNRYKVFDAYNLEWLEYVVDCRNGGLRQREYDVVEGGVANDNVIDTVELYENGDISAEQAIGQLAFKKVNHQLAILNQSIVDACLKFIGSEEVPRA